MKTTYAIVCNNNGCQFLRDGLKKREASNLACSHANYFLHDVSIVEHTQPKKTTNAA